MNSKTGTYDIRRHRYLRQTFVTVWVCADGSVVDGHKHFVEAAGHSEHQLLVKALHFPKEFPLANICFGPKNSRPRKFKLIRRCRMSDALREMLEAPLQKGKVVIPLEDAQAVGDRLEAEAAKSLAVDVAGQDLPDDVQDPALNRCMARTWGNGLGKQCANLKRPDSDYCGKHAEVGKRKHGRVDEDLPAFMLPKAHGSRAARDAVEEAVKPVPQAVTQKPAASKKSTTTSQE